jgi:hypothetical protein
LAAAKAKREQIHLFAIFQTYHFVWVKPGFIVRDIWNETGNLSGEVTYFKTLYPTNT